MEQNKEQDQGDGLAAETRQLLDAATPGPWQWVTNVTDTPVAPGSEHPNARSGDEDLSLRTVAEYPTRSVGPLPIFVINWVEEMHEVQLADGSWSWPDAALIAAAPRLLANWLARNEQTEAVEDDLGRIANENAALAGRLMAERDRLADENRALREREQGLLDAIAGQDPDQCAVCGDVYCSGAYCLKQMVAELPDEHQELPEPIEKVQDMVRLGRILSEWAAADRGVTDGDRNEGDEG